MQNTQENHLFSSIEKSMNSLREASEEKVAVAKKATDYIIELTNENELSTTKKYLAWLQPITCLIFMFLALSIILFICSLISGVTVYFAHGEFPLERFTSLLFNSGLSILVWVAVLFVIFKVTNKLHEKELTLTDKFFDNKFTTLSRAEFNYFNNIAVDATDWQNPNFWQQMNMNSFMKWSAKIASNV